MGQEKLLVSESLLEENRFPFCYFIYWLGSLVGAFGMFECINAPIILGSCEGIELKDVDGNCKFGIVATVAQIFLTISTSFVLILFSRLIEQKTRYLKFLQIYLFFAGLFYFGLNTAWCIVRMYRTSQGYIGPSENSTEYSYAKEIFDFVIFNFLMTGLIYPMIEKKHLKMLKIEAYEYWWKWLSIMIIVGSFYWIHPLIKMSIESKDEIPEHDRIPTIIFSALFFIIFASISSVALKPELLKKNSINILIGIGFLVNALLLFIYYIHFSWHYKSKIVMATTTSTSENSVQAILGVIIIGFLYYPFILFSSIKRNSYH